MVSFMTGYYQRGAEDSHGRVLRGSTRSDALFQRFVWLAPNGGFTMVCWPETKLVGSKYGSLIRDTRRLHHLRTDGFSLVVCIDSTNLGDWGKSRPLMGVYFVYKSCTKNQAHYVNTKLSLHCIFAQDN